MSAIAGYHMDPVRAKWARPGPGSWGLEVEIYTVDPRDEFWGLVGDLRKGGYLLAIERDGSLPNGAEIITPPISKSSVSEWLEVIGRVLIWGKDNPREWNVGFHISFWRPSISVDAELRLAWLLTEIPPELCVKAFGRSANHYCRRHDTKTLKEYFLHGSGMDTPAKGLALSPRSEQRLEVRVPRASRDVSVLMHRVKLLWGLLELSMRPEAYGLPLWFETFPPVERWLTAANVKEV